MKRGQKKRAGYGEELAKVDGIPFTLLISLSP
jgi:hypothetical protein